MGIFNRFKKKSKISNNPEPERLENYPEMLTTRLLFIDKPTINAEKILNELKKYVNNITHSEMESALMFAFPDFKVELADVTGPAQCIVFVPEDKQANLEIPDEAFQQNWHWTEAEIATKNCRFELLVTDILTRTLECKQRLTLYINFLIAVIKATKPNVVYAVHGQKLIDPEKLINGWDSPDRQILHALFNVRLFNITGSDKPDLLMDTIGLNAIGLPDFQIRFSAFEANEIANLLWNYAYYIYDKGDIIENGNTLEGTVGGSKWKCDRIIPGLQPERVVINVQPD
ncbi:DUF4261 domain-containing protein [Mucilaginibacter sp. OK283]|jgi:hypothetical protein|uniref:DUF4261 domain-containing protein n=1 Tax=Mucilaginibacter sp. OK283 TaxID=1881049 RepID=UPI0008C61EC8|nr:DUF4261 domain-containing protein [Mucilaginibacter sp. OK283]SEO15595.1 protein of unknown function [Mucilaginibacter sp. OK283]